MSRSLRRSGALAALLGALVAAACLLPSAASAIEIRSLSGAFGPDGTEASNFAELGPLAFDQGNKRLLALDQPVQKIDGFDASVPGSHTALGGSYPLSAPTASFYDDIAVDSSSHDIYLASRAGQALYGFDESGATLPGFPITGFNTPCGVTVDSAGNVWVSDRFGGYVYKYSSTGTLLSSILITGLTPCRLAVDDDENLFIAGFPGAVKEYTAASQYSGSASKVIDSEPAWAITIDHSTNELYVVHEESIAVYDEVGTLLYEFGNTVPGAWYYGELGGIAIDETSEEVFVSDYNHAQVDAFTAPLSFPKITTEGADAITASEATVHGTINPRSQAVENCHFEVVPASEFIAHGYEYENNKNEIIHTWVEFPCEPSAGSIPVDANPHAVSADVTGLNPATVYHYRLAAKNLVGEGHGFDRQFTTSPAAPLISEQSVLAVGTSDATVSAKINPRGGQTTYHLEYGTTNAYGQSSEESGPFGFSSDTSKHPVSVHIGGLEPGTAYHFRFVATNPKGSAEGPDSTFATYPTTSPTFAPCPNDSFRTGAGTRLPDCRAYEQGTPIEKHGAGAQGDYGAIGASASGDRFTFFANGGLPTSGGFSSLFPFLASRGPNGWSTDGLLPPTQPQAAVARIVGVSDDLSVALVQGEGPGGVGSQLFLRDSDTGAFQPGPAAPGFLDAGLVGFAADPSHLAFLSETQLLPSAPAGKANLYDLDHGTLTLLDRVPAGSATSCDDEAGPACVVPPEGTTYGAAGPSQGAKITRDGSRIFFASNPAEESFNAGRIYMREDGKTTWISASQRTTPDPSGEKSAELAAITPDGSKVFFLSCEKLTDDSTAVSTGANSCTTGAFVPVQGQDLYSYDVETGELADLTVDSNAGDPLGATVQEVLGTSEDGSYVYFFADGVLAEGASLGTGVCPGNSSNPHCNLYAYHDGVTTFIAQLNWQGDSRVSADGRTLVFRAREGLTDYNNASSACPQSNGNPGPCREFFRYSAPEEELLCLTCLPTGTPPTGNAYLGGQTGGSFIYSGGAKSGPPRNLSADGNRFFFDSGEAMVPGDTNGVFDVYEWEAKGTGSCESEDQNGGCIYLISSGTDPAGSGFLDASTNGDHVFFFTEQKLVPTDQDQLFDVYDAGVGAGLAAQHELAPATCSSTACQANPAPPPDPSLASAAYSGAGNAHRAPKGRKCPKGKRKVRKAGKVSCKQVHKQHKRHTNRGGSK
jgi:hypothetical protein